MALLGLYDPLSAFCMGAFRDSPVDIVMPLGLLLMFLLPGSCLILLAGTALSLLRAKWRIRKFELGLRIFVLAVLLFLSVGEWTGLRWYALARGTRWRIEREIPLAEFQRWVVSLNRDYGSDIPDLLTKDGQFDPCVPEAVRHLVNPKEYDLSVVVDEMPGTVAWRSLGPGLPPGMAIAVQITYGGGFLHWGVVVGPPGFMRYKSEDEMVYPWVDGIYGFVE